jgi:hypothetical protein
MPTKTEKKNAQHSPVLKKPGSLAAVGRFGLTGNTDVATVLSKIQTTVTNTTSNSLVFGFLPPHGRTLAAGESLTIDGDIQDYFRTGGGRTWQRKKTAFDNAITSKFLRVDVDHLHIAYCAADSSTVLAVGDLVYLDTDDVKPAASFTWDTNIATTQAAFANSFLGICMTAKASGAAATNIAVQIAPTVIYKYTCTSETHEIGNTFGPAKNPLSNALLSQQLVKSAAAGGVARGQKRNASASTTAIVRFQSAFWGGNAAGQQ